eukprot:2946398-Amphidinium_carterae.1
MLWHSCWFVWYHSHPDCGNHVQISNTGRGLPFSDMSWLLSRLQGMQHKDNLQSVDQNMLCKALSHHVLYTVVSRQVFHEG